MFYYLRCLWLATWLYWRTQHTVFSAAVNICAFGVILWIRQKIVVQLFFALVVFYVLVEVEVVHREDVFLIAFFVWFLRAWLLLLSSFFARYFFLGEHCAFRPELEVGRIRWFSGLEINLDLKLLDATSALWYYHLTIDARFIVRLALIRKHHVIDCFVVVGGLLLFTCYYLSVALLLTKHLLKGHELQSNVDGLWLRIITFVEVY